MSEAGGLCRWCVGCQLTMGFIALFLWLSYRPIKPRFYVTSFSLAAGANSTALKLLPGDPIASFVLEIENKNKEMGIYHDPLNISLSFLPNSSSAAGAALIPAFYQGHQKTADKSGTFSGPGFPVARAPWAAAVTNGTAVFRVGLESAFRYKVFGRKTRHHSVRLAGDVQVDAAGKKTAKKGIRLSSAVPLVLSSRSIMVLGGSAVYILLTY
ncbi:protein NDR1 [Elaeis guineensis]|uniref:protein NDR1 n=1 Tax=Elaeis guineensis var. tenera TaxID=51953 RepID=A0A6J0PGG1_ELAGV|nr:protein NDR1 [Elaeis guineensis]XP_019705314.1 protein NDR1 [Elaeis guineensis]